ncbi:MAG: Ig domain-containing protein, partial [Alcanivoracaceae bacterium]|nr:Ig domain-containing protein [Alcanivoracaceae bacterium]
ELTAASAKSLPAWLELDPSTGVLRGREDAMPSEVDATSGDHVQTLEVVGVCDCKDPEGKEYLSSEPVQIGYVVRGARPSLSYPAENHFDLHATADAAPARADNVASYEIVKGDLPANLQLNDRTGHIEGVAEGRPERGVVTVRGYTADKQDFVDAEVPYVVEAEAPKLTYSVEEPSEGENKSGDAESKSDDIPVAHFRVGESGRAHRLVPRQVGGEPVSSYELTAASAKSLPAWLELDPTTGVISGTNVPVPMSALTSNLGVSLYVFANTGLPGVRSEEIEVRYVVAASDAAIPHGSESKVPNVTRGNLVGNESHPSDSSYGTGGGSFSSSDISDDGADSGSGAARPGKSKQPSEDRTAGQSSGAGSLRHRVVGADTDDRSSGTTIMWQVCMCVGVLMVPLLC